MNKSVLATILLAGLFATTNASADEYKPLGPFHVGATVGAGFPSPISVQGVFKYKKLIGANLELGMLPEINTSFGYGIRLHQEMIDFGVHVYPFSGAFFLGLGIGAQRLTATGEANTTYNGTYVTGDASAVVSTVFLSPRLGLLHRFDFGLAIGMDVGVELPISGSVDLNRTATSPKYPGQSFSLPITQDVADIGNRVKTTPIPIIHILQLGYLF